MTIRTLVTLRARRIYHNRYVVPPEAGIRPFSTSSYQYLVGILQQNATCRRLRGYEGMTTSGMAQLVAGRVRGSGFVNVCSATFVRQRQRRSRGVGRVG